MASSLHCSSMASLYFMAILHCSSIYNIFQAEFFGDIFVFLLQILVEFSIITSEISATTKKRYSDTTIQRYRNRNLEPEPGTGTWNRA